MATFSILRPPAIRSARVCALGAYIDQAVGVLLEEPQLGTANGRIALQLLLQFAAGHAPGEAIWAIRNVSDPKVRAVVCRA
jgi:hypothetical protein